MGSLRILKYTKEKLFWKMEGNPTLLQSCASTLGEKRTWPLYLPEKIFHYEQLITALFSRRWLICLRCLTEWYQYGVLASKT